MSNEHNRKSGVTSLMIEGRGLRGKPYRYEPLPTNKKSIRLLRVHPAHAFTDPLICTLRQYSLKQKPLYTALSYSWGDGAFDSYIICDSRELAITSHLDLAIRRFRGTNEQVIWIDAICIDQSNIDERNHQINLMPFIYQQTFHVFVYLGEATGIEGRALVRRRSSSKSRRANPDTWKAINLMAQLARLGDMSVRKGKQHDLSNVQFTNRHWERLRERTVPWVHRMPESALGITLEKWLKDLGTKFVEKVDLTHIRFKDVHTEKLRRQTIRWMRLRQDGYPGREDCNLNAAGLPLPGDVAWGAMRSILSLPWFTRVWVIQEVVSCPEVTVLLGDLAMDWSAILEGIGHIDEDLNRITNADGIGGWGSLETDEDDGRNGRKACATINALRWELVQSEREERAPRGTALFNLVQEHRAARATDPRDKIYALLGLATDTAGAPAPDYSRPFSDIYYEYARFFVERGFGIRMLDQAGLAQSEHTGQISWVPNWSEETDQAEFLDATRHTRAAGSTTASVRLLRGRRALVARALYIDKISATGPELKTSGDGVTFAELIEWEGQTRKLARSKHCYQDLDANARTLIADSQPESISMGRPFSSSEITDQYHQAFSHYDYADSHGYVKQYIAQLSVASKRRFCVTKTGRIGLVPALSKPDDLIYIFLGGGTPHVLLKTQETYRLIGNAYIDDIMQGEALEDARWKSEDIVLQ